MRIWIALLIASTVTGCFTYSADAAEPVSMSVQTGFDGAARLGTWLPVKVVVSNRGADIKGELEVQVDTPGDRSSSDIPSYIRSIAVNLPRFSQKGHAFDINVPAASSRVTARLVSQGSVLLEQDVPIQMVPSGELLTGVIAHNGSALDFLGTVPLYARQRNARVAHVEETDLPANAQSLAALDCLIIANPGGTALSRAQGEAIESWVAAGGLLIVAGSGINQRSIENLPAELLPVKISGSVQVGSLQALATLLGQTDVASRGPWLIPKAEMTDGVALASQDGVPLLAAARRGAGSVFYLALDPAAEPLASWSGSQYLWRYLLSQAPAAAASPNVAARQYSGWGKLPRQAIGDFSSDPPPSPRQLAVIFLVYAVAVVPGSYLVMRRARAEISSAILLTVGVVTGVVVFAVANATRQPDLLMNEVTLVRATDSGSSAQSHTYLAITGLRNLATEVSLPADALPQSLLYPLPQTRFSDQRNWVVKATQERSPTVREVKLTQNQMSTFALDGSIPVIAVVADLQVKDSAIRGIVTNRSKVALEDAAVIVGGRAAQLGALGPGESKPIEVDISEATNAALTEAVEELVPDGPRVSGRAAIVRDILESSLLASYANYARIDLSTASLVAWLTVNPQPVVVSGAKINQHHYSLLVASLPVRLAKGEWSNVPGVLIEERPMSVTLGGKLQSRAWSLAQGETAAMEFRLPFSGNEFAVNRLALNIKGTAAEMAGLAAAQMLGSASLFDWQRADWTEVLSAAVHDPLLNPQRFVSPLGLVRLRYTFQPPTPLSIDRLDVSAFDIEVGGVAR